MALKKSRFLTATEFAALVGVTQQAVSKAIQNGRLRVYDGTGEPVSPGHRGRKWLKLAEARADWDGSRVRLDDDWLCAGLDDED